MNDHVRQTVKEKMKLDRVTQTGLADDLHMSRTNLVRLLSGNAGQIPRRWAEILDALELELIAVPKDHVPTDVLGQVSERPIPYSKLTAKERAARDERDKGLPEGVRELLRRADAGELKDQLRMFSDGYETSLPAFHVNRSLCHLDDAPKSLIKKLDGWGREALAYDERQTSTSL